jgi:hypothetical protein
MFAVAAVGCADADRPFLESHSPIATGKAKLIVYRKSSVVTIGQDVDVKLDGKPICAISNGTAFVRQIDKGRHKISADTMLTPGVSIVPFTASEGNSVYVRIDVNGGRIARGFIPVYGLFNQFTEAGLYAGSGRGNVFTVDLVAEPEAREELKEMAEAKC